MNSEIQETIAEIRAGMHVLEPMLIKLEDHVNAIRARTGWISIKDRVPEVDEHVLVWDGHFAFGYVTDPGKVYLGRYPAYAGQWRCEMYGYDGEDDWADNVTHWMPLPNPPKEE